MRAATLDQLVGSPACPGRCPTIAMSYGEPLVAAVAQEHTECAGIRNPVDRRHVPEDPIGEFAAHQGAPTIYRVDQRVRVARLAARRWRR